MKTILITQFTLFLFVIPNFSLAQFITVSGYVNNAVNGSSLENVSIFETNSEIGTITNQNGFYKLVLDAGLLNLTISESGFKQFTQKFDLESDTTLIFKLQPNSNEKNRQKKNNQVDANMKLGKESGHSHWLKLF